MAIASVIAAEKAKNANGVSAPQPSLPSQTLTEAAGCVWGRQTIMGMQQ